MGKKRYKNVYFTRWGYFCLTKWRRVYHDKALVFSSAVTLLHCCRWFSLVLPRHKHAYTQRHMHTHKHTHTHTQAPVVLVSSRVHSIICWLNNDFKKSSKLIKKKACVKLALSLLTFLISYIELQDLFDNFQKIWCTVFNIGLFCCMCCILFKNWTNWGLCYKWQSFLCIICLINWFSTMGGYWLFVPGAEMQVFPIFKLSSKTPLLSWNPFLCWLNFYWTADSAQWPDGSVSDECCLECCANYLVKTVKQSWYCLLKNPDNAKCHLMFCLKVKAISDAGTIIDIIIENSALNFPPYSASTCCLSF